MRNVACIVELRWDVSRRDDEGPSAVPGGIKPELVELYKEVGKILRRFTTGKVPKAFKIIPKLENWEDVSILNYLSTVFSTSEASQLAPSWEGENQGCF